MHTHSIKNIHHALTFNTIAGIVCSENFSFSLCSSDALTHSFCVALAFDFEQNRRANKKIIHNFHSFECVVQSLFDNGNDFENSVYRLTQT